MIPSLLSYPPVSQLSELTEATGRIVYVIKRYPEQGVAMLIAREPTDKVSITFSDFDANQIDMGVPSPDRTVCADLLVEYGAKLITLMKVAGIKQAIYYMSKTIDGFKLVDVRVALDKFLSPGMLRDLFGKILPTQEVLEIVPFDDIKRVELTTRFDVIVKCSAFKTIARGDSLLPCYGKVSIETECPT